MADKTYVFNAPEHHTLELDDETYQGGDTVTLDEARAAGIPGLVEQDEQEVAGDQSDQGNQGSTRWGSEDQTSS